MRIVDADILIAWLERFRPEEKELIEVVDCAAVELLSYKIRATKDGNVLVSEDEQRDK